jgi:chromosome segregation ATPase
LSESIATLEELEMDHAKKMDGFHSETLSRDRQYKAKMQRANEEHKSTVQALTAKYEGLAKKRGALERSLIKIEETSRAERDRVERETAHFRKEVDTVLEESKCDDAQRKASSEVVSLSQTLEKAEGLLSQRENELLKLRTESENLKREIGRLRHEKEIAARRTWKVI